MKLWVLQHGSYQMGGDHVRLYTEDAVAVGVLAFNRTVADLGGENRVHRVDRDRDGSLSFATGASFCRFYLRQANVG